MTSHDDLRRPTTTTDDQTYTPLTPYWIIDVIAFVCALTDDQDIDRVIVLMLIRVIDKLKSLFYGVVGSDDIEQCCFAELFRTLRKLRSLFRYI